MLSLFYSRKEAEKNPDLFFHFIHVHVSCNLDSFLYPLVP